MSSKVHAKKKKKNLSLDFFVESFLEESGFLKDFLGVVFGSPQVFGGSLGLFDVGSNQYVVELDAARGWPQFETQSNLKNKR